MLVSNSRIAGRSALAVLCSIALLPAACGGDEEDGTRPAASDKAATTTTERADADGTARREAAKPGGREDRDPAAAGGGAGGGGDRGADGQAPAAETPPPPAAAPKPKRFAKRPDDVADADQRKAIDTVASLYDALAAGDARGVCARMSAAAKDALARSATPGPGADCVTSFESILGGARTGGAAPRKLDVEVIEADVRGSEAEVTVSFGGRPGKVALIKESGRWRVGSPVVAGP